MIWKLFFSFLFFFFWPEFREQNSTLSNVYILACENDPTIRYDNNGVSSFISLAKNSHISRTQIIDYGCQIQAKIFIIRRYSRGRDLNKFFNDFLNCFWSNGQRLYGTIPSILVNFFCCLNSWLISFFFLWNNFFL